MPTTYKAIGLLRGLGLGFLAGALVFVFTLRPEAFAIIPIGGAIGLAIGWWRDQQGAPGPAPAARAPGRGQAVGAGRRWALHPSLAVRFLGLLAIGLALFVAAWAVGYWLLPEGILRGRTAGAALAGETAAPTFMLEWGRLFIINLALGGLIVFANRAARVWGFPLGYVIPLLWFVMYGATLGTNSFAIPLPERLPPSLAVLGRSGLYELTAFVLAAAATAGLNPSPTQTPTVSPPSRLSSPRVWAPLAVAVLLLAAANAWEAWQIVTNAPG